MNTAQTITRRYNVLVSWLGKAAEFTVDTTGDWDDACDLARKTCRARCGLPQSGVQKVTFIHVVG